MIDEAIELNATSEAMYTLYRRCRVVFPQRIYRHVMRSKPLRDSIITDKHRNVKLFYILHGGRADQEK